MHIRLHTAILSIWTVKSEEWTLNTDWNIQFMNSKIPDVYFVFSYSFAHIFGHSTKFEFQMLSPFFSVMLSHRLQCDRILRYHILTFDYTLSMNIEQFTCANTFEFFCRDRLGYKLPVLPITTKNVNTSHTYVFFIYSNKKRKCKKPQILSIFAASI